MQLFDCKYMRSYLTAQIYFLKGGTRVNRWYKVARFTRGSQKEQLYLPEDLDDPLSRRMELVLNRLFAEL